MKYIPLIAFVFIFCICCTNNKNSNIIKGNNEIDSIYITYLCGNIDSNVAIKCEKLAQIQKEHPENDYSLLNEGIVQMIDTFIVDKKIIDKIKPLLEKRETTTKYTQDARMYVSIKYPNKIDNICLGMNTPNVLFNNESTIIENKLVYLLRKYSGYYEWFNEEDISSFEEYQDC